MCDKFWCIWSSSYNCGDPAFTHDENCYECVQKWKHGCCLCGHYYEEEGGCEYETDGNGTSE